MDIKFEMGEKTDCHTSCYNNPQYMCMVNSGLCRECEFFVSVDGNVLHCKFDEKTFVQHELF